MQWHLMHRRSLIHMFWDIVYLFVQPNNGKYFNVTGMDRNNVIAGCGNSGESQQ